MAKEHASLGKLVKPYLEFEQVGESIAQAEELLAAETDPDMKAYAEEELAGLRPRARRVEDAESRTCCWSIRARTSTA